MKISIESTSEKETAEACERLLEMIPAEIVVPADEKPWIVCDFYSYVS